MDAKRVGWVHTTTTKRVGCEGEGTNMRENNGYVVRWARTGARACMRTNKQHLGTHKKKPCMLIQVSGINVVAKQSTNTSTLTLKKRDKQQTKPPQNPNKLQTYRLA